MATTPTTAIKQTLQSAATTGNGTAVDLTHTSAAFPIRNHTFYLVGSSGISAGAVQIESAHDPTYSGTWKAEGSAVTLVAGAVVTVVISNTAHLALRARISTTVVGGTLTAYYTGN